MIRRYILINLTQHLASSCIAPPIRSCCIHTLTNNITSVFAFSTLLHCILLKCVFLVLVMIFFLHDKRYITFCQQFSHQQNTNKQLILNTFFKAERKTLAAVFFLFRSNPNPPSLSHLLFFLCGFTVVLCLSLHLHPLLSLIPLYGFFDFIFLCFIIKA